jgi:putative NADH-flavin reductase
MKIVVVGAGGRTGRHVLEQGLARGHEVVGIARDAAKLSSALGSDARKSTRIVTATAADAAALTEAFRDVDAVVSALGPNKTSGDRVLTTGITATLAAMKAAGVRRLVVVSASGHLTDGDAFFVRMLVKPILGALLRTQYADMREMERIVQASSTDWTIMRPPMLTDKDARGSYQSRRNLNVRSGFTITREDLAAAILDQLEDDTTIRQALSVAN